MFNLFKTRCCNNCRHGNGSKHDGKPNGMVDITCKGPCSFNGKEIYGDGVCDFHVFRNRKDKDK